MSDFTRASELSYAASRGGLHPSQCLRDILTYLQSQRDGASALAVAWHLRTERIGIFASSTMSAYLHDCPEVRLDRETGRFHTFRLDDYTESKEVNL